MVDKVQELSKANGRGAKDAAVETAPAANDVAELYERLAAPFETTFRDQRGGVELEYITGEQCVSRLNQVLGPLGWSFVVREHGPNAEADEIWVLGELTVTIEGVTATRQQ